MKKIYLNFYFIIVVLCFLSFSLVQTNFNYINDSFANKSTDRKKDLRASFTTVYTDNGSAICNANDIQYVPEVCTDGAGGVIICWIDNRDTPVAIYAQRIDYEGTMLWGTNGKFICNLDDTLYYQAPQIISDGAGGAVITFTAERTISQDIYAQRIDADGDILWDLSGITICSASNTQENPKLINDEGGCFIIAWEDFRSGNLDIFAQKIDLDGNPKWDANGVVVTNAPSYQRELQMISDGLGGAIIVWEDERGLDNDIYAQKINSNGESEWTPNGVSVCNVNGYEYYPQLCSDGKGGAFITWDDSRKGTENDIYCQRIEANGDVNWTINGIGICTEEGIQGGPQICSDGAGGAITTWGDDRSGTFIDFNIYAQRVDSEGNFLWADNGTAICVEDGFQYYPQICSDGLNGAIIAWDDNRTLNSDIFAQWIDCNGTNQWMTNGNPICRAAGFRSVNKIDLIELGSVLITWVDDRNGNSDIYCQKIIYNAIPTSNHPGLMRTLKNENKTVDWILYDDLEGGKYRVWIKDPSDNLNLWQDWQPWINNIELNVKINTSVLGTFTYTIEYYDKLEFYGVPDIVTVIVHTRSHLEISFGCSIFYILVINIIFVTFAIKRKINTKNQDF
ncbi:MAG: hypothetical protein ACFFDF_01785 [Candidatus Odinarchaeota archaeon]